MVCAIDIGGTWTKIAAVDAQGAVYHFKRIATAGPGKDLTARIHGAIQSILTSEAEISEIGVSVAGYLNPARSMMTYNPNLPWLENFPLQAALQDRTGLPVTLEVDSNAAALGECHFGNGAGAERFLCLTIGTGLGAGFLNRGAVVRFTGECLGDPGHIILEPGGRLCTCGGRGCAEALVSAPAILLSSHKTGMTLEDLAPLREPDPVFTEAGKNLGLLAASLASIFSPDRIALGGGVPAASPLIIEGAQNEFARSASDWSRAHTAIVPAALGSRASLIGAALAVTGAA